MQAIIDREGGNFKLASWDWWHYAEKLRQEKYALDDAALRPYFKLENVRQGIFTLCERLYGLKFTQRRDVPVYNPEVTVFEVRDADNQYLGVLYMDFHPRPGKRGGAWSGSFRRQYFADGKRVAPLSTITCNFTRSTADAPSLLSVDEVETFFHEFGHCLHTILSESRYWQFGGTNVERDFVEAPSQMFENWMWDADVLATFARHYETGEPFPDDLLAGMLAARNMGSGMKAERQYFYGLYDLMCHTVPDGVVDTTELGMRLWDPEGENVELYDPVPGTYFQASFGHLTGYQAGYYGYQWALVFACDMFERFQELGGMLDPDAGAYYRRRILSRGGTIDGIDLVEGYLGRESTMDPYLVHLGLEP